MSLTGSCTVKVEIFFSSNNKRIIHIESDQDED